MTPALRPVHRPGGGRHCCAAREGVPGAQGRHDIQVCAARASCSLLGRSREKLGAAVGVLMAATTLRRVGGGARRREALCGSQQSHRRLQVLGGVPAGSTVPSLCLNRAICLLCCAGRWARRAHTAASSTAPTAGKAWQEMARCLTLSLGAGTAPAWLSPAAASHRYEQAPPHLRRPSCLICLLRTPSRRPLRMPPMPLRAAAACSPRRPALPLPCVVQLRPHPVPPPAGHAVHALQPYRSQGAVLRGRLDVPRPGSECR